MTNESGKTKRKKPNFFRRNWDKKIKLGKSIKKKRKWRRAKGRDNKIRLKEKGYPTKPTIGWGADKKIKNKINGIITQRIENLQELNKIKKGAGIIIGKIGMKKRQDIIKTANEKGIIILNKYRKINN